MKAESRRPWSFLKQVLHCYDQLYESSFSQRITRGNYSSSQHNNNFEREFGCSQVFKTSNANLTQFKNWASLSAFVSRSGSAYKLRQNYGTQSIDPFWKASQPTVAQRKGILPFLPTIKGRKQTLLYNYLSYHWSNTSLYTTKTIWVKMQMLNNRFYFEIEILQ